MQLYFFVYLLIINILAFFTYGADKRRAVRHKWRIPENTLLLLALIGGSIGALAGMYFFRHKTKHVRFFIGVPVILFLQLAAVLFLYIHR